MRFSLRFMMSTVVVLCLLMGVAALVWKWIEYEREVDRLLSTLGAARVDDAGNAVQLSIDMTYRDGERLEQFHRLLVLATQVEKIRLTGCDDAVLEVVQARAHGLKELEIVFDRRSRVTTKGWRAVGLLPKLQELRVMHGKIGGDGAREIVNGGGPLRVLEMDWVDVTDDAVTQIAASNSLREVSLEHMMLTDHGILAFRSNQVLRNLSIYGFGFSKGTADSVLESMPNCRGKISSYR